MVMLAYCGPERMLAFETVPKKYNAQVRVRISREVKREMNRLAKSRKIRPSDLYRQAIEDYLKEQEAVSRTTASGLRVSLGGETKSA